MKVRQVCCLSIGFGSIISFNMHSHRDDGNEKKNRGRLFDCSFQTLCIKRRIKIMILKIFAMAASFISLHAMDIQKYLPENPHSVYVYSDAKERQFVVVQNDGISNGCINQYTISLSEENPPTNILNKEDMKDFLQNIDSDKFYKSYSITCFKDHKIYTQTIGLFNKKSKKLKAYNEDEWKYTLGKEWIYTCTASVKKSVHIFQKDRDVIHTVCTDKKHNATLQWWFAEGIGRYQSGGNAGNSTLKSIITIK